MNPSNVANSLDIEAMRYIVCSFGGLNSVPLALALPKPLDHISPFVLTIPTVTLSISGSAARRSTCLLNNWMGRKRFGSKLDGG